MKTYKYIGLFRSDMGHEYKLEVNCNGFIQAFFLLTADAIRSGKHYQLHTITGEDGNSIFVDDIIKVSTLFYNANQVNLEDSSVCKVYINEDYLNNNG
jgi:hypothetical protein